MIEVNEQIKIIVHFSTDLCHVVITSVSAFDGNTTQKIAVTCSQVVGTDSNQRATILKGKRLQITSSK